jgi:hypothetical protein
MKRLSAGILTVLVMGGLAWMAVNRPPAALEATTSAGAVSNPAEARIHGLLQDAWNGDVSAYLAAFGGETRRRLERKVEERGREAFASDLRRSARARKSHAVFAAEAEGDDAARITVETVYPDRNERQTYRLERSAREWLVTEVETIRSHQPKAKYGSPASYGEPEGVPVQAGGLTIETGEADPNPAAEP